MKSILKKSLLAGSFLALTGTLAFAQQQMYIYRSGNQTVTYDVSTIDSVKFMNPALVPPTCFTSNATLTPNADSWTTVSGSITAGGFRYYLVPVVSGSTYQFSTTSCYGSGSASYDSYLTLYNSSCNSVIYNNDVGTVNGVSCSGSYLSYTATYTGYMYIRVSGYQSNYGSYALAYKGRAQTTGGGSDGTLFPPTGLTATLQANQTSVMVRWRGATNALSYELQRSADNLTYTRLAVTSDTFYLDNSPRIGVNYYKVKMWTAANGGGASSALSNSVNVTTPQISSRVYVGVMGFNVDTMPFAITNNLGAAKTFISGLTNAEDYTALSYAVQKAVPMYDAAGLPAFDKIFLLSFTDGRDNQSSNLWSIREGFSITDDSTYGHARLTLLQKYQTAGLRSYSIGLGTTGYGGTLTESQMNKLVVGGGSFVAASNSAELTNTFNSIANNVLASAINLELNLRYFATGSNKYRLTVTAVSPSDNTISYTDNIDCKVERVGENYVITIEVQDGVHYATFTPGTVTIRDPGTIRQTLTTPLNNLHYTRDGVDYIVSQNVSVSKWEDNEWKPVDEDKVQPSSIDKKIAVMLVLDCSTSLTTNTTNYFPILKDAANKFVDILSTY